MLLKKRTSVPQFGTWDAENIGYTVYFEKVRENKGGPVQTVNPPNEPQPIKSTPPPSASSGNNQQSTQQRPAPEHHQRRGNGNGGGSASAFPPQSQPSSYAPSPAASRHSGVSTSSSRTPAESKTRGPSGPTPQGGPHRGGRGPAVPAFGEWEQTGGNMGYTVAFEKVKQHKDEAKSALPDIPQAPPAQANQRVNHGSDSFVDKILGCFRPRTREY